MKRLVFGLCLVLPALAGADQVFLRSGGKLSGQVVSEDARTVVMEVGPGRVSVPATSVLRIERGTSPISAFRERAARLAADDAAGWLSLAFWALERDLGTQAQEALERVLRLDPQNAAANAALGRVQSGGRWVTVEESYREQGYVQFEGDWITPAEHEARLRAQAADAAATSARREGELRVREAEARARAAEAEARRAEAEAAAATEGGVPAWGWGWGWGGTSVIYPPIHPPLNPPPSARGHHGRPRPEATPLPPNPLTRPTPRGGATRPAPNSQQH